MNLIMICDNSTKYTMNAVPYLGSGNVTKGMVAADYFAKKLNETIKNSNGYVTMDNWFSKVPPAEKMLKEDKLTIVGMIKKNKREFPLEFTDVKYQE
ncbi:piggyBac transposable element-derived protein 4 [Nephila pilipes]|uniref:PiggyBac transposable element-derived protein 4 n=1 Tax=Nephila pilipes TaxID=299642 RepID=A0A8X6NFV4_NEPPI|nr:piggyBac transposable element-derived protein 4 [Nephila pilipes]